METTDFSQFTAPNTDFTKYLGGDTLTNIDFSTSIPDTTLRAPDPSDSFLSPVAADLFNVLAQKTSTFADFWTTKQLFGSQAAEAYITDATGTKVYEAGKVTTANDSQSRSYEVPTPGFSVGQNAMVIAGGVIAIFLLFKFVK